MQKTKTKSLRVLRDGGVCGMAGWWLLMDGREQKVGRRGCEGEQLAIGDGNFAPRLAGSDGGFAVGWQFDKFDKFDKFVTLNKLLPGGGARKQLVIRVLCALLAYLRIFWEWVVPSV